MKSIGGYFGKETLVDITINNEFRDYGGFLEFGRSCLFHILNTLEPTAIYIPYYICDVVIEICHKLDVTVFYYDIDNNFEISKAPILKKDELLLYVNYFGLKLSYISQLNRMYKSKLIIDNVQGFFDNNKISSPCFTSCRKWFGVIDGALLNNFPLNNIVDNPNEHVDNSFLYLRNDGRIEEGYEQYKNYEKNILTRFYNCRQDTIECLRKLQLKEISQIRRRNFIYLHNTLSSLNVLHLEVYPDTVPFFYPFLPSRRVDRATLHNVGIFAPTFWPSSAPQRESSAKSNYFINNLIPLPIDQRITISDCDYMISHLYE
jgi:hypothetical protein